MSSTETPFDEERRRSALLASTPLNSVANALARLPLPVERRAALSTWFQGQSLNQLVVLKAAVTTAIQEIVLAAFALDSILLMDAIGPKSPSPKASPSDTNAETGIARKGGSGAAEADHRRVPVTEVEALPPPCERSGGFTPPSRHPRFPSGDCVVCGALCTQRCQHELWSAWAEANDEHAED